MNHSVKNIFYGYVANVFTMLVGFISRTIFINTLGMTYLGVDGLFANVLGVLSFSELGIGAALNYCLYKPVADNDTEKIKSVMALYKKAYTIIGAVVVIFGLALTPFIEKIVNSPQDIGNVKLYFLLYLANTASSYFLAYKQSLINAEQKNYLLTKTNILFSSITVFLQILALILTKNFVVYLLILTLSGILRNLYINILVTKKYPILREKNVARLPKEDIKSIIKNVKGLIFHSFAGICVHQTDNIIISMAISIVLVGKMANYNLILQTISGFVTVMFSSIVSSLGNLVASENKVVQHNVFKVYNFVNFWIYGFCSIAFLTLATPLITLWLGTSATVDNISWLLVCLNYYLMGQRISFLNFKTAYGVFYDDKYVVFASAFINLVISIIGAKYLGLAGVFLGTLISGLYQSIRRPVIAYKRMFGVSVTVYFKVYLKYFTVVLLAGVPLYFFSSYFLLQLTILKFIVMMAIVAIVPNAVFFVFFRNTKEFKESFGIVKGLIEKCLSKIVR